MILISFHMLKDYISLIHYFFLKKLVILFDPLADCANAFSLADVSSLTTVFSAVFAFFLLGLFPSSSRSTLLSLFVPDFTSSLGMLSLFSSSSLRLSLRYSWTTPRAYLRYSYSSAAEDL